MRAIVIAGSHPRNLAILERSLQINSIDVVGQIIYHREDVLPDPPEYLGSNLRRLWSLHFNKRKAAEDYFFNLKDNILQHAPTHNVFSQNDLNSIESVSFVKKCKPDICIITGVPIIKEPLFIELPDFSINLHLGLIPYYKGSITMFWPFYLLEPSMAGCTYHVINKTVDTGEIIHQIRPSLEYGDGMHDVACKASVKAISNLDIVISDLYSRINSKRKPQFDHKLESLGKTFKRSDFKPQMLELIYDHYEDQIVDHYLNGNLPTNSHKKLITIN